MMVADASVWINLAATGGAHRILEAIGRPLVITDLALGELERGRPKGRRAADEVAAMLHLGLAEVAPLMAEDEALFLSLVSGSASETLDDGEAATLACAERLGAWAVIDERKATSLAARRLPHLEIRSTCDLLLSPSVRGALGEPGLAEALFAALMEARMRVPDAYAATIVGLLGSRAASCLSIPARFRAACSQG
ncbi:MAG TPA: type II toxin-antitoxin system VapC family toxin [Caulobacteraceae bacterium]|nr:type II toxin-antitoxin system VapC family toxin [Caulobacteraceae bacterium]